MSEPCRLVCPHCRRALVTAPQGALCPGCGSEFRALRGILDLRTADDVYMLNAADWDFALRLNEDYDRLDFRGLLERYYDLSPEIPADLRRRQIAHIIGTPERIAAWRRREGMLNSTTAFWPVLDLGCGSGSFLAEAIARREAVARWYRAQGHDYPEIAEGDFWGLDIALRWLLVARKRLDEEGHAHVRLVCGCAERLPFPDRTFHGIIAGDVIEHVADQAATLAEVHRILRRYGRLYMVVPNRYSLAPEPHVQVWGVGFLPRRWMAPYVRWKRQVDFRAIRTLGYGEWKRLLRRSSFRENWTIIASEVPESDLAHFGPLKRRAAECYNRLVWTTLGHRAALAFGPSFRIYCGRVPGDETRSASRATRRRSTPRAAEV